MRSTTLFILVLLSTGLIVSAQAQQKIADSTAQAQQKIADNMAARAYGSSDFRLGPDDVIEVSVYQEKELSTTVPVRPDGKISVPLIGEMPASGKTAIELQKDIAEKYGRFISDPSVTVVVKEINSPKVSVLGEVKTPGIYKIKDRATVLDVIALAGGLTEYAKKDKVTVIRVETSGEQRHIKLNLEDYIKGRRLDAFYVLPYDKIYVQ
jgi:polysaccharide biosynthesis/export protein